MVFESRLKLGGEAVAYFYLTPGELDSMIAIYNLPEVASFQAVDGILGKFDPRRNQPAAQEGDFIVWSGYDSHSNPDGGKKDGRYFYDSFALDDFLIDNLFEINLAKGELTSIAPFGLLDSVQRLDLSENKIASLTSMRGLYDLEWLNLADNKVSSLIGLKNYSVK